MSLVEKGIQMIEFLGFDDTDYFHEFYLGSVKRHETDKLLL